MKNIGKFPGILKAISHEVVNVWRTDIHWPEERMREFATQLSLEELARAKRFHFKVDFDRHVISRALTRLLIGSLVDLPPREVSLVSNRFGKPSISKDQNPLGLEFNVSHSGEFILIALTAKRQVGVDIEHVNQQLHLNSLVRDLLSVKEQIAFSRLCPDQRQEAFFNCWTRKEAFIKAKGAGLSIPLNGLDVSFLPGEPAMLLDTRPDRTEAARWTIRDLEVAPAYKAAIAAQGADVRVDLMEWPILL